MLLFQAEGKAEDGKDEASRDVLDESHADAEEVQLPPLKIPKFPFWQVARAAAEGASDRDLKITAQLVVDCSGKRSPACRWIKALGLGPLTETILRCFLTSFS